MHTNAYVKARILKGFLHNQLPHFTVELIGNKVETGIVV